MRRIRHCEVELPTLQRILAGGYELDRIRDEGGPPDSHWTKPDVRGAVHAMNGRVCAFCQREPEGRGQVEHFRPRHHYRWLTYDLSNYVLACGTCNSRKRDHFPVAGLRATYALARDGADIDALEDRLFLSPLRDDIDALVMIDFDGSNSVFRPHPSVPPNLRRRVETTIKFFGLNDDPDIAWPRDRAIDDAWVLLDNNAQRAREIVRRRCNRYRPYGAVVRAIVTIEAPDLVPTPEEEIRDHVDELVQQLAHAVPKRDRRGLSDAMRGRIKSAIEEIGWSLQTLIASPPEPASVAQVQTWIDEAAGRYDVDAAGRTLESRILTIRFPTAALALGASQPDVNTSGGGSPS